MTALKVIGILLAVLAFLLLAPVSVQISLEEEWRVTLRYLLFRFRLYPPKEKKKRAAPPVKQVGTIVQSKPVYPVKGVQELSRMMELWLDMLHSLSKPFKKLMKGITFYSIRLKMTVSGEDPSEIAVAYGKYNAWLYGTTAALKNFFKIKNTNYQLIPLFVQQEEVFFLKAKARVMPVTILAAGLLFGWKLIKAQLNKQNTIQSQTQEGQNDGTDKRKGHGAAEEVQ